MTDTPDLRTLAAEALALTLNGPASDGRGWYRNAPERVECFKRADAVLAAVLPAHRRQVLDQAAEVLAQDALCNEDTRYDSLAGAAVVVRRLASAAPETAPSPRQDDETAPAVRREATQAQRAAEGAAPDGPRTWQLPDDAKVDERWGVRFVAVDGRTEDAGRETREAALASQQRRREMIAAGVAGDLVDVLVIRALDITTPWEVVTDATPADGQDGPLPAQRIKETP